MVIREFPQVLNPSGGLVLVGQRDLNVRVIVLIRGSLATFVVLAVILLALLGAVFIFGFVVLFGFGRIPAVTAIQRRQLGFDNAVAAVVCVRVDDDPSSDLSGN